MNRINELIKVYISRNVTLTPDMLKAFASRISMEEAKTEEQKQEHLSVWMNNPMYLPMYDLEVSWALG